jgi:glucose/arabinose dehydrogenase
VKTGRPTSTLVTIGLAAALVLAACGSDEGAGDTRTGSAVIATTAPPTTVTSDADRPEPPTTGPDASPGTSAPGADPPRPLVAVGDPNVAFEEVTRVDQPVGLAWRSGDPTLFVVGQAGVVTALDAATGDARIVLDLSDLTASAGERGLLGLAFAPSGDLAYVNYSGLADSGAPGRTVIAEYAVASDGTFDASTARVLLEIEQPFRNHNGGHLVVGPDGLLYIGMGDGGSGGDPQRLATDPSSPHGSLLRIDPTPTADTPYTVPPDNPFLEVDGAVPETFAIGLRNPWKFGFDPLTGDLWIADVGQDDFEEVNFVPAPGDGTVAGRGANFGWSAFEGFERFNTDVDAEDHTPPVLVYENGPDGCSVIGGAPYRGEAIDDLWGGYVYSDLCSGIVWVLDLAQGRNLRIGQLDRVTSVLPGPDQELYVTSATGPVYRIVPAVSG